MTNRKEEDYAKGKGFYRKDIRRMNEMERLKYETAAELGLLDQLKKSGWKSLSAVKQED